MHCCDDQGGQHHSQVNEEHRNAWLRAVNAHQPVVELLKSKDEKLICYKHFLQSDYKSDILTQYFETS